MQPGAVSIEMPTDLRPNSGMAPLNLDPELNTSKRKGITRLTVNIPSSNRSPHTAVEETRSPSRWKSLEFTFYYVVFLIVMPVMIWVTVDLSSGTRNIAWQIYELTV